MGTSREIGSALVVLSLILLFVSVEAFAAKVLYVPVYNSANTYVVETLNRNGFEIDQQQTVPADLSPYQLIILSRYEACTPTAAGYIKNFVQNGGGAIISSGCPTFLAGWDNLSSIRDWFGGGWYGNDGGYAYISFDNPFGTNLLTGDIVSHSDPAWAGAIYNLNPESTLISTWGLGGRVFSFIHSYGQGRVFYLGNEVGMYDPPFTPEQLENNLKLFEAGLLWTANIKPINYPFPQFMNYSYLIPYLDFTETKNKILTDYMWWVWNYIQNVAQDNSCQECEDPQNTYRISLGISPPCGQNYPNCTVSEGIGYGMLIAVSMASNYFHEDDLFYPKRIFDGLWKYYKHYRDKKENRDNIGLMPWLIDQNGNVVVIENGWESATDAEEDVAMALLIADKQWGSSSEINYKAEAGKIINEIMEHEVFHSTNPEENFILRPGVWGGPECINLSYISPAYYRAFYAATGDNRWNKVIEKNYSILRKHFFDVNDSLFNNSKTGLVPEWSTLVLNNISNSLDPKPPKLGCSEPTEYPYAFYYSRVPWRIGMDYIWNGNTFSKCFLKKINSWIKSKTSGDPNQIVNGYYINGDVLIVKYSNGEMGPVTWNNAVTVGSLGVGSLADGDTQNNRMWSMNILDMLKDYNEEDYFADTLKLITLLIMTGNIPNVVEVGDKTLPQDSDCDGLTDSVEIYSGTNPYDDDTDDDGLVDGFGSGEDINANGIVDPGETDPRKADTDDDGIQDGTELGLTEPEGQNTNIAIFIPDADPSTRTDPLNSDSDGDGHMDGNEDSNGNGRTDPGESNPLIADKRICSIVGNDPKPSILDQDIFKFEGMKGEEVTIKLERDLLGTNTGERATLILKDWVNGAWLLKTDGSALPNIITAVLPATGKYFIVVAEQPKFFPGEKFKGNYCLTLQSSQSAFQSFGAFLGVE